MLGRFKNKILPLLLVFAAQKLCAQWLPAEDFFNGGAQLYISNNIPAALERTETGLKIYPNDEKLQKLEKLLKQQQQSQSQQNQQQQNQQNQSQQQSSKNDQQKNQQQQNSQQSQNQDSQPQKQDQQKQNQSNQKKNDGQKSPPQNSSADKQQNENQQQAEAAKAGEMTPEEAKKLLDAQKDNEQLLQMKPADKPRDTSKPVKDW